MRRAVAGVAAVAGASVLAACSSAAGEPGALPVPTFPDSATAGPSAGPTDQGRLPDDCIRVINANDLGALLGLPVDSVAVHTTIGAPAESVGRTERLGCQYTRSGGAHEALLDLNVGAYTDPDAALKQWQTNVAAEDGDHRDVALGDARGVLVERPAEAALMVANGAETLTFVLPDRIRIRDLSAGDTLVDLALRVLPTVARGAATPATVPPPSPAQAPQQERTPSTRAQTTRSAPASSR